MGHFFESGAPVSLAVVPSNAHPPPHDLEAERSVLGSAFIKPAVIEHIAAALQVGDFFLPAHVAIYESMLELRRRAQPTDVLLVADELRTRGALSRLDGGQSYLNDLANATPTAENVAHYARIVKDKATLRRLRAAGAELYSSTHGDVGDVAAFALAAAEKVRAATRAAAAPTLTLAERARALGAAKIIRLATPFATLNTATRGGLRAGRTVIGGAPGAGKTTLLLGLALAFAARGIPVTFIVADEGPDGLLIRIGQAEGYDRDDLEDGRPATVDSFAARVAEFPSLVLLDGDDVTVEQATAELVERARGQIGVLMVDSLQTVRARGADEAASPRERIDTVMAALRTAARRGLAVVATSEVGRAAYRSRNPGERIDGLASFKESGGIEYGAELGIVLRSAAGEVGLVDVEIVKNRWGSKPGLRLRLDFARATFEEVPTESAAPAADGDAATALAADVVRARTALAEHPGVTGKWDLARKIPKMSRARQERAISALEAAGEIENRGTPKRPRWYLSSGASPELPASPRISPGELFANNSPHSPRSIGAGSSGGSSPGGVTAADGSRSPRGAGTGSREPEELA